MLFEYDTTTDIYTVKFEFDNVYNPTNPFSFSGKNPLGSLIQSTNGKLYGMTIYGGTSNIGVVFEFDPVTDTYSKKLDFDGSNGKNPEGSLMQASNGNLYGMTRYGGTDNVGVIFEFDSATDTYSKKLDFNYYNGFGPLGGLIEINADVLIIPDIANLPDVDAQCEVTAISPPTANNGAITATTSTTFPIATQGVR